MKKLLIVFIFLIVFITGCSLGGNTPSDKVAYFLDRYKNNETVVINELNQYLDSEKIDDDLRDDYKEVYLRQYTNLKYNIKDETINGDEATVDVQITVFDYFKSNKLSGDYFITNNSEFVLEDGSIDENKYASYKINKLLETTDTVDYTITFNLQKLDGEWVVQDLSLEELSKIHGTYEY